MKKVLFIPVILLVAGTLLYAGGRGQEPATAAPGLIPEINER